MKMERIFRTKNKLGWQNPVGISVGKFIDSLCFHHIVTGYFTYVT